MYLNKVLFELSVMAMKGVAESFINKKQFIKLLSFGLCLVLWLDLIIGGHIQVMLLTFFHLVSYAGINQIRFNGIHFCDLSL